MPTLNLLLWVAFALSKKGLHVKIGEAKSDSALIKNFEVLFGEIVEEEEWEPLGPTPMPSVTDLRSWDRLLLSRYKPFYSPFCDMCCLCTYGKCDLTLDKKGVCGIDIRVQQARMVLLTVAVGAATHTAHARTLLNYLIEKFGERLPINAGLEVSVEAPITRLVTGIKPRTLGDLDKVLRYVENQITQLLAAVHTGQEGDYLDYESKALHAGMMDHLALEVADIAQISAYNFPKGKADTPLVEIGLGAVDLAKPLIMCIGHNVSTSVEIIDYLREKGLMDAVEVVGLCCTGHDVTRYCDRAKIVGAMAEQIKFIRSGAADVIVVDEQCVRADVPSEAIRVRSPVIATTDKLCHGLPDLTEEPPEKIVHELVTGQHQGALILDPMKAGVVAVQTAIRIAPMRKKYKIIPEMEDFKKLTEKCDDCGDCRKDCPYDLPVDDAVYAASKGDLEMLANLHDLCLGCTRCEITCPQDIPVLSLIEKAAERKIKLEKYKIRAGRGFVTDVEIRNVGAPIVLGVIPGVIGFAGCANYPHGGVEVAEMAEEFARRNYIVVASGCAAMSISKYKDKEGRTLYELYPGVFDAGGLSNVGACVANCHIIGAAIKIANIFARRPLRANYEEIADYILNRVGAVVIAWGAMSQKAYAIATGANRLGIPVIIGPYQSKYRRLYLGHKESYDEFSVYDARTGEKVFVGPAPEHLCFATESKEEAIVYAAKLCIRPNDTTKGRQIKLNNYVELHKRYMGTLPDDIHLLVRSEADIPITMKEEILACLKEKGWQPGVIPDPTLLRRMIRAKKP